MGCYIALGQQPTLCPLRVKTTDLQAACEFVHGRLARLDKICTWGGLSRHLPRFNLARRLLFRPWDTCHESFLLFILQGRIGTGRVVEATYSCHARRLATGGTLSSMPSCLSGVTPTPSNLDGGISATRQSVAPLFRRILSAPALAIPGRICGQLGPRHTEVFAPCLVAVALDPEQPVSLCGRGQSRPRFFDRPAARLGWWEPAPGGLPILGGRICAEAARGWA